jgi:DNA replication and repair protein RecF
MSTLVSYQRALRNKANLLRTGQVEVEQLRVWNEILAEPMSEIYRKRIEFVKTLQQVAGEFYQQYGPADGELTLELQSTVPGEGTIEAIREKLEHVVRREIATRSVVIGSHRDELAAFLGGKEARSFASQGQARSIVLALKLAVISLLEQRYGESPVIVLDDVESELDSIRSSAFFDLVFNQGRQVFITGTDIRHQSLLSQENVSVHEVSEGEIAESTIESFS